MILLVVDDHTRREVWRDEATGRILTRLPGEDLAEAETVTIRSTAAGTSVIVAFPWPPRLAIV